MSSTTWPRKGVFPRTIFPRTIFVHRTNHHFAKNQTPLSPKKVAPKSQKVSVGNSHVSTSVRPTPAHTSTSATIAQGNTLPQNVPSQRGPTPIRVKVLSDYLEGDCHEKRDFLLDGFENGFSIPYNGVQRARLSRNHASIDDNPQIVSQLVAEELRMGRIAGPFDNPPLPFFQVSPLGLIPKKEPNKFRLIHDLSFPHDDSINSSIPSTYTTVQYETLDHAIQCILSMGNQCLIAKGDIEKAFRILPIHPKSFNLLGFMWKN
jgi:hypothetical protein